MVYLFIDDVLLDALPAALAPDALQTLTALRLVER
jgi:hypothetical protein